MSKEELARQQKYADDIKSRLSEETVPSKHAHRPVQYREFLQRELKKVTAKIDSLKLAAGDAKK